MAGPATNAATISVLWKSLGKKATLAYLISIIGGALFFGVLIDYVLPATWFSISESVSTHIHGESTSWIAISSTLLLIGLILIVELKKVVPKKQIIMENSNTYTVNGMTCNHCKSSVETNLIKATNIDEVVVNLGANSVTVKGNVTSDEVKNIS